MGNLSVHVLLSLYVGNIVDMQTMQKQKRPVFAAVQYAFARIVHNNERTLGINVL
jgi:hypothetical protein